MVGKLWLFAVGLKINEVGGETEGNKKCMCPGSNGVSYKIPVVFIYSLHGFNENFLCESRSTK